MNNTYFNRILGTFAVFATLLFVSNAFAGSDYLLEIEGIKGEAKGKKFTLTENTDGSFTVTNIPAGTYKLIAVPAEGTNPDVPHQRISKVSSITMKFECVVSPRDAASGLATGKRQHKPLTITKELDKMSPKGSMLGEIVVGDLDGDGASDRKPGDPIPGLDVKSAAKGTSPKSPVKATYDLAVNKKI